MSSVGRGRRAAWSRARALVSFPGAAVLPALLMASLAATALWQPALAGPDGTATVLFGKASLGQRPPTVRPNCPDDPIIPPGPPACFDPGHDDSANALDDIVPRTVVISEGGSVTFIRGGGNHRVGIYAPGTDVNALKAAVGTTAGFFNIDDAVTLDRVYHGPPPASWPTGSTGAITTPPLTFDKPGTYLLVCTFTPHFRDLNMYGTIVVQEAQK